MRNPDLYAFGREDYWKLFIIWKHGNIPTENGIHPLLGWSQAPYSAANPYGLKQEALEALSSAKPKVFFYGDSFVDGSTKASYTLPQLLSGCLKNSVAVDLGVGGFGFDQTYLLFHETHSLVPKSHLIVGILLDDLDRTLDTVRHYQKPYFRIESGVLSLKGAPVERNPQRYLASLEPKVFSYLYARVAYLSGIDEVRWTSPERAYQDQVKGITGRIIANIKKEAGTTPLVFVIFHQWFSLKENDWRETYLKEEFTKQGLAFLNTKPVLLQAAQEMSVPVTQFYNTQNDGHHNTLGNEVVAKALCTYLGAAPFVR